MGILKELQKKHLTPLKVRNKLEEKIDTLDKELRDLLKTDADMVEDLLNILLPAISLRNINLDELDKIIEFKKIKTINEEIMKESREVKQQQSKKNKQVQPRQSFNRGELEREKAYEREENKLRNYEQREPCRSFNKMDRRGGLLTIEDIMP